MQHATTLSAHFDTLPDPRIDRCKHHKLIDIVTIAICAVISNADGWTDIAAYGRAKHAFLQQFLDLPNGIPSHDTFGRVFTHLDPRAFQSAFLAWVDAIRLKLPGDVVAIDGKTERRTHDRAIDLSPLHIVSAWSTANRLVLGQVRVDTKSNEITAIPVLLDLLDLEDCIVTIDAMGCQVAIAEQIGGQIFIDSWGWLNPGNPQRAADMSARAASVAHDGNGLHGARWVAAAIAQAFVAKSIDEIIETGLSTIDPNSTYARVARAVIDFHKANPDDWRACRDMLTADWGYDRYAGVCHIIPNAGVTVMAIL